MSIYQHVSLKQETRKGQLQELVKMVDPDLVVKGKEGYHLETIDDALVIAANEPGSCPVSWLMTSRGLIRSRKF
jgi:hypothetical protein